MRTALLCSFSVLLHICNLKVFAQQSTVDSLVQQYTRQFYQNKKTAEETYNNQLVNSRLSGPTTTQWLQGITENGLLQYMQQHGLADAATVGVPVLYTGGGLNLSLSGATMNAGMWDFGLINSSHRELRGRIRQSQGSGLNEHFTHCAGIVMASGVNPLAKGMAYNATLTAYDADNDAAEMLTWGTNGGAISNHSYGYVCGWNLNNNGWYWYGDISISNREDYRFGLYTSDTQSWDNIAFLNPNYIIVKSVGNDRADVGLSSFPSDGPYDCIEPKATGKNTFVVGAVEAISQYSSPSNVKLSTGSSWGPTDDGRIKPDFVTCGVNVVSSSSANSSAYATITGTSQAAANATGSLSLIQELGKSLYGQMPRSATVKGLAIHCAKEAGTSQGPDYSYGWGLLDVSRMARLMIADSKNLDGYKIEENTLDNGGTYSTSIYSDGSAPLLVSISWTDYQGTPPGNVLDPTNLMLVNDLDVTVTGPDNVKHYPWTLNPAFPSNAAVPGINNRDNVERVDIATPAQGNYTITVSHKGTLSSLTSSKQNYSLIASSQSLDNNAVSTLTSPITNNTNPSCTDEIYIYPNPATQLLWLEWTNAIEEYTVIFYNTLGYKVWETQKSPASSTQPVNIAHLAPGAYEVKIQSAHRVVTKRIIKQ